MKPLLPLSLWHDFCTAKHHARLGVLPLGPVTACRYTKATDS